MSEIDLLRIDDFSKTINYDSNVKNYIKYATTDKKTDALNWIVNSI